MCKWRIDYPGYRRSVGKENDFNLTSTNYVSPDLLSIGTSTYPGVELEQASSVLSNWTGALPPPIELVSSEGEGVGAMRTWSALNLTVMEELTNQTGAFSLSQTLQINLEFRQLTFILSPSLLSSVTQWKTMEPSSRCGT